MGAGIALITLAGLGTSPISSPAYVLALLGPLSFGLWTIILTALFFLAEIPILGPAFRANMWLQIGVGPALGLVIDLFMAIFPALSERGLALQLCGLALGCILLALGIWMQIKADVIINPGEGIVKAIAYRLGRDFGSIKLIFDSSLVAIAAAVSLLTLGRLEGIGVGTLISAVTVGPLVRLTDRLWQGRKRRPERAREVQRDA